MDNNENSPDGTASPSSSSGLDLTTTDPQSGPPTVRTAGHTAARTAGHTAAEAARAAGPSRVRQSPSSPPEKKRSKWSRKSGRRASVSPREGGGAGEGNLSSVRGSALASSLPVGAGPLAMTRAARSAPSSSHSGGGMSYTPMPVFIPIGGHQLQQAPSTLGMQQSSYPGAGSQPITDPLPPDPFFHFELDQVDAHPQGQGHGDGPSSSMSMPPVVGLGQAPDVVPVLPGGGEVVDIFHFLQLTQPGEIIPGRSQPDPPVVPSSEPMVVAPPVPSTSSSLSRPVDDHGWQESRSRVTERAEFLLNNSRMSDIRFLVGEHKVEIFGHKTILAMGSPVFEAQFFGAMKSDLDCLELSDLDPDTFLMFLKYIYTDKLESVDDMKVLHLLRPAKKYLVPHLIEKCSDILMSELKPETVFEVYKYAVFFDLKKLEGACLRFIDRECESIVQNEEFTMLDSQTLADFLKRDGLNAKENVLFKAVLRWAELECERRSVEPTDENIREALGDNIKLIRFPTMSPEEFATEVASRNILTAEEARSIFIYMCCGYQNRLAPSLTVPTPEFPTKKRGFYPEQYLVSRFSREPQSHSLNYRSGEIYTYRINFKADKQIFFKGVNIFSIKCVNAQYADPRRFNGAVYLYECDTVACDRDLSREKGRKQFSRDSSLESEHETSSGSRYYPVLFDQEVRIPANQMFTVCAVVSVVSSSYQQQPLNTFVGCEEIQEASVKCAEDLEVNFCFSNCYGEASVGKYTQSQIPEIVFSL